MADFTHIKAMSSRQFAPGSMLLLLIALWAFAPRLWDTIVGEPWLDNQLNVALTSQGTFLVEDSTLTASRVHGSRTVYVEAGDGSVLCSTEHYNTWSGERKRFWRFQAFARCPIPEIPFRVCSGFSLTSEISGRHRLLGPFCTVMQEPVIESQKEPTNDTQPHSLAPHRRAA